MDTERSHVTTLACKLHCQNRFCDKKTNILLCQFNPVYDKQNNSCPVGRLNLILAVNWVVSALLKTLCGLSNFTVYVLSLDMYFTHTTYLVSKRLLFQFLYCMNVNEKIFHAICKEPKLAIYNRGVKHKARRLRAIHQFIVCSLHTESTLITEYGPAQSNVSCLHSRIKEVLSHAAMAQWVLLSLDGKPQYISMQR